MDTMTETTREAAQAFFRILREELLAEGIESARILAAEDDRD
jgi:hypothetical protein